MPRRELEFFNGLGGFAADGREYVTILGEGQWTPAPWINVIANPSFGFQVSVEGAGYTWAINSQQHQITQWSNDPVSDRPGEVIYVHDLDTDELWGPTAHADSRGCRAVRRSSRPRLQRLRAHLARNFARVDAVRAAGRLDQDFAAEDSKSFGARAAFVDHRVRGMGARHFARRIRAVHRHRDRARNPRGTRAQLLQHRIRKSDRIRRLERPTAARGRRTEPSFSAATARWTIPRRSPAGKPLSARAGAAIDPCAALQTTLSLRPDAVTEVVFLLGEAANRAEAISSIKKYRDADLDSVLSAVTHCWDGLLGTIQVKTPDRSMDVMLNRWLLYQTLACRVWARSAFYQAGGAYGFRDQLQDVMALTMAQPATGAGAPDPRRGAPVCRRRRATLVASARGPGSSHPHRRRSRLAARLRWLTI